MHKLKMKLFAVMLPLALASCTSSPKPSQPVPVKQSVYPGPESWSMQPPSNSLEKLDQIFLISGPESLQTGQS